MPRVSRRAVRRYYRTTPLLPRLLVVPEHNLLYLKNPKAACSTILVWLDRMHTGDHDWVPPEDAPHRSHRLPRPKELGGMDRMLELLGGEAYRFSFVRHPLHRVESAYRDKLTREGPHRPMVQATLGLPEDPTAEVTFDQFLAALEQQDPFDEMDRHWRPQHINLMHPVVQYEHVGKLETFDADIARIREEAGLPDVPLQPRNVSQRPGRGSAFDGRPDRVRRAEAIYALDFEVYGY